MRLSDYLVNLPVDIFLPGEEGRSLGKVLGIRGRTLIVTAPIRSTRLFWPHQGTKLKLVFPSVEPLILEALVAERKLLPVPILILEVSTQVTLQQIMAQPQNTGRIVAVTGGKGGTGKTCMAVNTAFLLSRQGNRVALIDCDWGTANIHVNLGIQPKNNLSHFIKGNGELSQIRIELEDNLHFYPGNSADPEMVDLTPWDFARFMGMLASLERNYDYLILDTGAGLGRSISNSFLIASDIIIVLNDTPSSLVDAYGLLKSIRRQTRLPEISLVMNRAGSDWELSTSRFQEACGQFIGEKPHLLGSICEDQQVVQAERHQRPLVLFEPNSQAAMDFKEVVGKFAELSTGLRRAQR